MHGLTPRDGEDAAGTHSSTADHRAPSRKLRTQGGPERAGLRVRMAAYCHQSTLRRAETRRMKQLGLHFRRVCCDHNNVSCVVEICSPASPTHTQLPDQTPQPNDQEYRKFRNTGPERDPHSTVPQLQLARLRAWGTV